MKNRFPYARTFLLGFGFLGISVIWPVFNQYIPILLQAGNPEFNRQLLAEGREIPKVAGFAMAPSLALFIMTWDNILNIFIQPWVGERSDRTWTRLGRPTWAGGILFNQLGRSAPFLAGALARVAAMIVAMLFVKEPHKIGAEKPESVGVLSNLKTVPFWARDRRFIKTDFNRRLVETCRFQANKARTFAGR